ncbi:MAG: hypothetical protein JNL42_01865 [Anaerolineae bacterium]|nr:hypothetical protein [Anaerolineae bacterium]
MARQQRAPAASTFPPDHAGLLIASVLLIVGGGGGILALILTQEPFIGQRWLFMLLLNLAVTGLVMPLMRYVNARLTPASRAVPPSGVIVRQSVWFGLFVVSCAWLQIPRVLSPPIMFFLALAFIIVEVFLRSREIPHERLNDDDA